MPCIVSKNRITCFKPPSTAKGRVLVHGVEYWCDMDNYLYSILAPDAGIPVYLDSRWDKIPERIDKKFQKKFTKWICSVEEYLTQLAERGLK